MKSHQRHEFGEEEAVRRAVRMAEWGCDALSEESTTVGGVTSSSVERNALARNQPRSKRVWERALGAFNTREPLVTRNTTSGEGPAQEANETNTWRDNTKLKTIVGLVQFARQQARAPPRGGGKRDGVEVVFNEVANDAGGKLVR